MGEVSKIEWCDATFNPWIGCTRVSPACDHCYAESLARRYGWATWGPGEPRKRTSAANWKKPLAWNEAAKKAGVRKRVFCASLSDVFDAEVPDEWRDELFAYLISGTPHLDWLLLTKRPKLMAQWAAENGWPENAWAGTTVENQTMADLRIPELMKVPARVRFLSMEPMLEPIEYDLRGINWVIVGGESGAGARYMEPMWARAMHGTCVLADAAFFMKQMTKKAPIPADLMIREFPA